MPRTNSCCSFQCKEFNKRNHLLKNFCEIPSFLSLINLMLFYFAQRSPTIRISLCENYGLRLFSRIFVTNVQNKFFLKVRIKAAPLQNRHLSFTSSSSFYVCYLCSRHRHGFSCSVSPYWHLCIYLCAHVSCFSTPSPFFLWFIGP